VLTASQDELWKEYSSEVAITKAEFDEYCRGAQEVHALIFREVSALKRAISLSEVRRRVPSFHPPQFFKKLRPNGREIQLFWSRSSSL
jgi:predicted transcriptional regulator